MSAFRMLAKPTPPDELTLLRTHDPLAVYRWATARGWAPVEAATWAAWIAGLDVSHPWTFRQVRLLLFLRAYYAERARR